VAIAEVRIVQTRPILKFTAAGGGSRYRSIDLFKSIFVRLSAF